MSIQRFLSTRVAIVTVIGGLLAAGSLPLLGQTEVQAERITLSFEIYKNGSLLANPRVTLPNEGTATLSQGSDEILVEISLTASRTAQGRIVAEIEITIDGDDMVQRSQMLLSEEGQAVMRMGPGPEGGDAWEYRVIEITE